MKVLKRWTVAVLSILILSSANSGCDFLYRKIQKEGAEEKDLIGTVEPLKANEKVREIQSLLKIYGYGVGNPDGTLGNNTREAIGKFQEDNHLKVTKFVDYATWGRLKFHEDIGLIKDGKVNFLTVQKALAQAGFDPGKIDGRAGRRTKEALKDFQKAKGLKDDGRIGLQTLRELAQYLY